METPLSRNSLRQEAKKKKKKRNNKPASTRCKPQPKSISEQT